MRWSRPVARTGRVFVLLVTVTLALGAPHAAFAEAFERDRTPLPDSVRGTPAEATAGGGGGGAVVRMIVGLAIVLAVIYGVYWLLKSHARSRAPRAEGGIGVVASAPLGQNRAVHLVRIGDELVLVGSAEQAVTRLRVYGAGEAERLGVLVDGSTDEARFRPARADAPKWGAFVEDLRRRTAR